MNISDLMNVMESIAPIAGAEAWDNVGLIVGDPREALRGSVLLTIDLTEAVVAEALDVSAGAIVAYHPPIFSGVKRITTGTAQGRMLLKLMERRIGVYSPHTALDAAPGGVCDWLLDLCGSSTDRGALVPGAARGGMMKVSTFVPAEPADVVERVRDAMAGAGAGRIGGYEKCSFRLRGTGTFEGGAGTNPAVGQAGRLESVEEWRLDMVCPSERVTAVLSALRGAHPYEEPAIDVYPLHMQAKSDVGAGRVGTLETPASARVIAERVKKALGVQVAWVSSNDPDRAVSGVAVCPGSGASLVDAAISGGAGVFVTGEMKHHEIREAMERGLSVVLAGHTETERGYLPVLKKKIEEKMAGVRVVVSSRDRAPLVVV